MATEDMHINPGVKVSVIMLTYNAAPYIETAILGVLRQKTDFAVQLVIADDHSTDGTAAICRRYRDAHPDRITLVERERNVGLQRNLMDAYTRCTGEYVALCDGDDYWFCRTKLQTMAGYMDAHPGCALAFHRIVNFYQGSGEKSLSNGGRFGRTDTELVDLCRSNYITNCSCLFRRANLPVMPEWFAGLTLCDYATHLINATHGSIHYFKRPMAVYRKHPRGLWSIADERRRLADAVTVRDKMLDYLRSAGHTAAYEALLPTYDANAYRLLALLEPGDGRYDEITGKLKLLHPGIGDDEIRRRIAAAGTAPAGKSGLKRVLSALRAAVSRLIPLPRP